MERERGEKLEGLSLKEKRKRWRAAPKRLFWKISATLNRTPVPFKRRIALALHAAPADQALRFYIPFVLAERALGDAAIIAADPSSIDHWLISEGRSEKGVQSPRDYFLVSGDWEPLVQPIGESDLDREVCELVAAKGEVRRTLVFAALSARIREQGGFTHNGVPLTTEGDIERYLAYHAALIDSIRTHGLVRHSALADIGPTLIRPGPNGRGLESQETDAGVAVGPTGRLLRYRGGFHRTAAARELGLKSMPVQVKLVHVLWLRRMVKTLRLSPYDALVEGLKQLSLNQSRV